MKIEANDCAFPTNPVYGGPENDVKLEPFEAGLSIRAYFAAKAINGILANPGLLDFIQANTIRDVDLPAVTALFAVRHADALIAALNEIGGGGG